MAKPMGGLALLIGSPKKGMGKGKPMPSDPAEPDADDGEDMGGGMKERAVEDFFTAGKSGDWKGAAAAAQRMYDACSMGGHEEPDADEEE